MVKMKINFKNNMPNLYISNFIITKGKRKGNICNNPSKKKDGLCFRHRCRSLQNSDKYLKSLKYLFKEENETNIINPSVNINGEDIYKSLSIMFNTNEELFHNICRNIYQDFLLKQENVNKVKNKKANRKNTIQECEKCYSPIFFPNKYCSKCFNSIKII
jgi:hypothetical protein